MTTESPRGPSIEVTEHGQTIVTTPATGASLTALADEGFRAIRELERVLFFTDVPQDTAVSTNSNSNSQAQQKLQQQQRAKDGYKAIHDLERVLFFAQDNGSSRSSSSKINYRMEKVPSFAPEAGCIHISCNSPHCRPSTIMNGIDSEDVMERKRTNALSSTALVSHSLSSSSSSATRTVLDLFKRNFEAALATGQYAMKEVERTSHEALKEAKRTLFFTDVDDAVLVQKNPTGASVDVFKELEYLLAEMEKKLSMFALETAPQALETGQRVLKGVQETSQRVYKHVERNSQKAYQECERTLLFTDLDESALAKDKTNDDLIHHFLNSQDVFQELERKFLFTDIRDDAAPAKK